MGMCGGNGVRILGVGEKAVYSLLFVVPCSWFLVRGSLFLVRLKKVQSTGNIYSKQLWVFREVQRTVILLVVFGCFLFLCLLI